MRLWGTEIADLRCQVCNEPCGQEFVSAVLGQGGINGDIGRLADDDATAFIFAVSPCCGRRECVETLWTKAAENFDVGSIEIEESVGGEEAPEAEPDAKVSGPEKTFLSEKEEVLVQKAWDWLQDHPEFDVPYARSLDVISLSSRPLVFALLHDVFGFPEDRAEKVVSWGASLGSPIRRKVEGVLRGLGERATARESEEAALDLEKSERLVPDCVAWAKGLGLRTLRQADVEVFLSEKGEGLGYAARRNLWTKASLALRVRRP